MELFTHAFVDVDDAAKNKLKVSDLWQLFTVLDRDFKYAATRLKSSNALKLCVSEAKCLVAFMSTPEVIGACSSALMPVCNVGVADIRFLAAVTTACAKRTGALQAWNTVDLSPTGRSRRSASRVAAPVL
jgi:hypothetical protein